MRQNVITFYLNETEKIILHLDKPLKQIHCCSEASIYFIQGDQKYLLAKDSILFKLQSLKGILMEALDNRLLLHISINKDIGYMYNEHRQGKSGFVYEMDPILQYDSWVGYKYLLWGLQNIAWIYNNTAQEIIFEITPCFPGDATYQNPNEPLSAEEIANSHWYEQWIKDYKPILIRKIPRKIAQTWLKQTNDILNTIETNIREKKSEK